MAHDFAFRFGHNKACYYCPSLSGEALCSQLCVQHLAQIRAALKLVQEDIKGIRSWLGDEVRLPCRDPALWWPAHHCVTDVKERKAVTLNPARVVKMNTSLCGCV